MTTTTSTATTTPTSVASSAATAQAAGTAGSQQLAGNFDTFLQLLTTQLQHQDPLSPLDTNAFTQELVQFASVEQQINTNTNMQTLISLQQTTAATAALQLVGDTVTINGTQAALSNATGSPATWGLNAAAPATGNITITSSSGQVAYTGTMALNAGTQNFTWSGQGANGTTWPDGTYTIAVTATGASGQKVAVTPSVQGVVTGVNMNQNPPTLTVGGQSVPVSAIQSISSANQSGGGVNSLNSNISTLNNNITKLTQLL